jgi:hypothetical protein
MSKNIIFQYLITDESVDKRGEVQGRDRKELYLEMADISRKSFEMYAEEIGCEYMYSDEKVFIGDYKMFDFSPLLFECLRVVYDPYFDQFDKVLFADTDIVVNTKENIFDVSDAEIYGVLESDIRTEDNGGYNAWDFKDKEFRTYVEKFSMHDCPMMPAGPLHGIGSHPSKLTILNTGVVVWTKEARLKARELFDDWKPWANPKEFGFTIEHHCSIRNDQPFISAQLMKHDFDLESIDQSWNDTPIHYKDSQHWIDSGKCKFLHYTGGDHKVEMVRLYHENKFPIFQEGW